MNSFSYQVFIVLCVIVNCVFAHNYVTSPVSRGNQAQTQTGCRYGSAEGVFTCTGPCDKKISQMTIAPTTIARGASITVNWVRHYHPGGFIRFAWSKTSESDSHASFDTKVDRYVCKEIGGCHAADMSDPSTDNLTPCGYTITVPSYLTDGAWTLQWAYFGGYLNAGDYFACVDYTISGGPSSTTVPAAQFVGGDATYPNENVCKFFTTNQLHWCTEEPCMNGSFPLGQAQKGTVAGFAGTPVATTSGIVASTTQASTTQASTTGSSNPSSTTGTTGTTGRSTTGPSTTGPSGTSSTTANPTPPYVNPTSSAASGSLCYLPGTPNLDGPINTSPPTCGKNSPSARCADGQCCSSSGYCGPFVDNNGKYYEYISGTEVLVSQDYAISLYCKNTTGDYRKVPCSDLLGSSASILSGNVFIVVLSILMFFMI